jgi:hypothetical protein
VIITARGRHVNYKKGEDEGDQGAANHALGVKSPGVVDGGKHRSHRQHGYYPEDGRQGR